MSAPRRIAISASAGAGHLRAAEALVESMRAAARRLGRPRAAADVATELGGLVAAPPL